MTKYANNRKVWLHPRDGFPHPYTAARAEAFLAALKKVELKEFPRGPVVIDRWGNPIQNVYIRKVERVGGALQNSVIFTYPAVSQFWKYNPEEFLKMPLYTRDYPPCKYC